MGVLACGWWSPSVSQEIRGAGPREGSVLSQMLGSNFQNFDFYPNWQNILGKDFISPIAEGGRITYEYDLQDSVFVDKDWCYKIVLTPKRAHDLAFRGTIWVTAEQYALRRLDLTASESSNINFVSDLRIYQDLTPPADGPGLFGDAPAPGKRWANGSTSVTSTTPCLATASYRSARWQS